MKWVGRERPGNLTRVERRPRGQAAEFIGEFAVVCSGGELNGMVFWYWDGWKVNGIKCRSELWLCVVAKDNGRNPGEAT